MKIAGLIVAGILILAAYARGQNLVVNGSFESPPLAPEASVMLSSIPGWTSTGGFELWNTSGDAFRPPPHDGHQYLELDAFANTSIYQDLTTVPGAHYRISLALANRPLDSSGQGSLISAVEVLWGGVSLGTASQGGTAFTAQTFSAQAGSTLTRLQFNGVGPSDTFGDLLDAVAVQRVSANAAGGGVYHFERNGGTALDSSGAGNHGTIEGPTYVAGYAGDGLRFSGSDTDRVLLPQSLFDGFGTTAYVSARVRPSDYHAPDGGYIFRKNAEFNDFWAWLLPDGRLNCLIYESGVSPTSHAQAIGGFVPLNQWSQIACYYDGTAMHAYVNGLEVATDVYPIASIDWSMAYYETEIGNATRYNDGNDYGFVGDIDEVVVSQSPVGRAIVIGIDGGGGQDVFAGSKTVFVLSGSQALKQWINKHVKYCKEFTCSPSSDADFGNIARSADGGAAIAIPFRMSADTDLVAYFAPGNPSQVLAYVQDRYQPGDRVFLVGFSAGAGDVQDVLVGLNSAGIPVRASGHIDSIEAPSAGDALGDDSTIPPNVELVLGFYQKQSPAATRGEDDLTAQDPGRSTVANTLVVDPDGPSLGMHGWHRNMDNDERVWGPILSAFRAP